MRPVSVFANGPDAEAERLRAQLRGPWRQAARAVMVLLSLHELPPAQIAELLECHPATARRWISRFNAEGLAGLAARTVDPAADPAVPGLAAGQPADAVPAGAPGGGVAAAEADRPRRPGP